MFGVYVFLLDLFFFCGSFRLVFGGPVPVEFVTFLFVFQFHLARNLRVYSASFSSLQLLVLGATSSAHPLILVIRPQLAEAVRNENDRKRWLLSEWEIEISYLGCDKIFRPSPYTISGFKKQKFWFCAGVCHDASQNFHLFWLWADY